MSQIDALFRPCPVSSLTIPGTVEDSMTVKRFVVTSLMLALCVPSPAGDAFAAAVPGYFSDEWAGLLCVQLTPAGSGRALPTLLQVNFDKTTNGGIDLATADALFAQIASAGGRFGPLAGANAVAQDCRTVAGPSVQASYTPSDIQNQFGVSALDVAAQLSASFQQFGFQGYLILDSFYNVVPNYLTEAPVGVLPSGTLSLRTDLLFVAGSNDVSYVSSSEVLKNSVVP
jgi:hypothetical protein